MVLLDDSDDLVDSVDSVDDQPSAPAAAPKLRPRYPFRVSRLMLKELRETLRDRRTLITLVLMPLLVYPALSLVFKTFLLNNLQGLSAADPVELRIVYDGDGTEAEVRQLLGRFTQVANAALIGAEVKQIIRGEEPDDENLDGDARAADESKTQSPFPGIKPFEKHRWSPNPREAGLKLETLLESPAGEPWADVAVYLSRPNRKTPFGFEAKIIHADNGFSRTAADYLSYCFRKANDFVLKMRLQQVGLPAERTWLVTQTKLGQESTGSDGLASLAGLIPLVLVLMTITGAVYPAIDLTAGERERGTLETLMAAPIPRFWILFSKFVAVVTVALLTAILNLLGMFATIWAFQLDKQLGLEVFNLATMVQILLLLVLFAGFFSAVLLVVTSFAKSFKEAQVYLIPVILLSLGPGLIAMAPEMKLAGFNTVCPMVNILLLARDVITGGVQVGAAVIVVLSTTVYGVLALSFAAKLFGSDAILYADANSLKEMVMRPKRARRVTPVGAAALCALLLVPMNFASSEFLNRLSLETSGDFQLRFGLLAGLLFLMFVLFPAVVAVYQRTNFKTGFGLRVPRLVFLIGGVLLGLSLWPIVMWLTTVWHGLYGEIAGIEARNAWNDQLVELTKGMAEKIQSVPWWTIGLCLAIAPAVCEEFFFRGMFQRSLLKKQSPWKAIAISALVFGGFHTINNSVVAIDRLIPTTLVGIVLGYLAYKSNSILPGVILHAVHNACVSYLAYFQQQLVEQPWFPQDEKLPLTWVGAAGLVAIVSLAMVVASKPDVEEKQPEVNRAVG